VEGRRMLDDPVTEQGPILHQTKHPNSLLKRYVLAPFRFGKGRKRRSILELA